MFPSDVINEMVCEYVKFSLCLTFEECVIKCVFLCGAHWAVRFMVVFPSMKFFVCWMAVQ